MRTLNDFPDLVVEGVIARVPHDNLLQLLRFLRRWRRSLTHRCEMDEAVLDRMMRVVDCVFYQWAHGYSSYFGLYKVIDGALRVMRISMTVDEMRAEHNWDLRHRPGFTEEDFNFYITERGWVEPYYLYYDYESGQLRRTR